MMHTLDLRGLHCPVTTTRLKRYLKGVAAGEEVRVLADDTDSKVDFPAVIDKMGARLKAFEHSPNHDTYVIVR